MNTILQIHRCWIRVRDHFANNNAALSVRDPNSDLPASDTETSIQPLQFASAHHVSAATNQAIEAGIMLQSNIVTQAQLIAMQQQIQMHNMIIAQLARSRSQDSAAIASVHNLYSMLTQGQTLPTVQAQVPNFLLPANITTMQQQVVPQVLPVMPPNAQEQYNHQAQEHVPHLTGHNLQVLQENQGSQNIQGFNPQAQLPHLPPAAQNLQGLQGNQPQLPQQENFYYDSVFGQYTDTTNTATSSDEAIYAGQQDFQNRAEQASRGAQIDPTSEGRDAQPPHPSVILGPNAGATTTGTSSSQTSDISNSQDDTSDDKSSAVRGKKRAASTSPSDV